MLFGNFIRRALMNVDASHHEEHKKGSYEWKRDHMTPEQLARTGNNTDKYSGVPAIPSDIGFQSGHEIKGKKNSGVAAKAVSNPVVIIGMGLTTLALLGMFRKSIKGDRMGAQRYMQYRIMAQFFTVTALVAGVTWFSTQDDSDRTEKPQLPKVIPTNAAI